MKRRSRCTAGRWRSARRNSARSTPMPSNAERISPRSCLGRTGGGRGRDGGHSSIGQKRFGGPFSPGPGYEPRSVSPNLMGRAGAEHRAFRGPRGPLPATPSLSHDRAWCRRSGEPEGPSAEGTRDPPTACAAPTRRQRDRRRVAGRAALGVGLDRLEGLTLGLGLAEGGPRGVPAVGPPPGPEGGHGGGVAVARAQGPPPGRRAGTPTAPASPAPLPTPRAPSGESSPPREAASSGRPGRWALRGKQR